MSTDRRTFLTWLGTACVAVLTGKAIPPRPKRYAPTYADMLDLERRITMHNNTMAEGAWAEGYADPSAVTLEQLQDMLRIIEER
jgi:hypothetical protein